MKFIVSSSGLLKNLQSISGILGNNNTLPILDNFLFEIKGDNLTITASDIETTAKVSIQPSMKDKDGAIAIPAKMLLNTLKTFGDIPITFNVNDDNHAIELITDDGKYKLAGFSGDEFPSLPEMDSTTTLEIDAETLAQAINKTVFATGVDELRPVMTGVYCELFTDKVNFVATDAHKLVRYTRTDIQVEADTSFIIPKKPLNLLKTLLGQAENKVNIEYNVSFAKFSFDHVTLSCQLIDGRYPNYNAVIPSDNPNLLTINRQQLINSLKRVAIFANQSTHQVRFKISGQELVLSSEDTDFSNEAKERLSCNYSGNDIEIGFNSKFIVDMLINLETDDITFELSDPSRAGIIKPIDADAENEDILMLVMPVMLNN